MSIICLVCKYGFISPTTFLPFPSMDDVPEMNEYGLHLTNLE